MTEECIEVKEPEWMRGLPGDSTCGTSDVLTIFGYSKSTSITNLVRKGKVPRPTGKTRRPDHLRSKLSWTLDSIRVHIHKLAEKSPSGEWRSVRSDLRDRLSTALYGAGSTSVADLADKTGCSMRDATIAFMVSEGKTYREVAEWCEVSAERVFAICKRVVNRIEGLV